MNIFTSLPLGRSAPGFSLKSLEVILSPSALPFWFNLVVYTHWYISLEQLGD